MHTLQDVRDRIDQWFRELSPICSKEDPWVYLCLSVLIDYLSRLSFGVQYDSRGKELIPGREEYIRFVEDYFPNRYRTFRYVSGSGYLPRQMYLLLRCGIVHSFSLVPDEQSTKQGARGRSIVLIHGREAQSEGYRHLDNYPGLRGDLDAALFVAADFFSDVKAAAYELLTKAATDPAIAKNVLSWFTKYPPIRGGF
jgi:hypothetical protein